jgi:hypothetical protein
MVYESQLTPKQLTFISAFIRLGRMEAVCKELGISKTTYYRWMDNHYFKCELNLTKKFVFNTSVNKIKSLLTKALDGYEKILDSEDDAIMFQAAKEVVKSSEKLISMQDSIDKYDEMLDLYAQKQEQSKNIINGQYQ